MSRSKDGRKINDLAEAQIHDEISKSDGRSRTHYIALMRGFPADCVLLDIAFLVSFPEVGLMPGCLGAFLGDLGGIMSWRNTSNSLGLQQRILHS